MLAVGATPTLKLGEVLFCEMIAGKWFEANFTIEKSVKGLDNSGIIDECDMIINSKKVEIKSATKNYFKYLMPKIHDVRDKPKDIYIGVKYNENCRTKSKYIY